MTAQFWGINDRRSIRRSYGIGLILALAVGALYTVLVLAIPEQMMRVFTSEEEVIAAGVQYLQAVAPYGIFVAISLVTSTVMRSTEDVHTPLVCSIASVATNTVLNYILIYGKLGFPALKLRGAAIATAIAMVVQAVLLFVIGNAKKNIIHAPIGEFFKKDIEFFKKFLRVCVPIMLNELLWERHCTPVELAQIGQYAENVFFGKPCGLMDQTASSVGGVVAIDFADTAHPIVERLDVDLHTCGYALCILDSGAGHEDLTGEYSAITEELRAVCRVFGKEVLREVPEEAFLAELPHVRKAVGDRAVNRAFHVYGENRRVREEVQALRSGDFQRFLTLVRESGRSSAMYLQNIIPTGSTAAQELMVTIALCERMLEGRGAVRVHGGGFGGTAQAFVPLDMLDGFRDRVEASLGRGCCHVVRIRPAGGIRLG